MARALLRVVLGVLVIGAILFLPAGTLRYWEGWIWMGTFLGPMLLATLYFARTDPALLERRMQAREERGAQKKIIGLTNLVFVGGFLLPGFDHRFGWSDVPLWVALVADGVVLASYLFVLWVLRTNSYASRTIRVEEGQRVIDHGPYAWVRHPMYTGVVVMMLASPIALGSLWAVIPFLLLPPLLILRIRDEEAALRVELPGYPEYCERVRWRLIPGVY